MAWALNVASEGTPMLFMGSECHLDGYWHDGPDINGDRRFDWSIAGDPIGMSMRRLVQAANQTRWNHPALRNGGLEVTHRDPSGVIAFKRWNNNGDVALVVVNAGDTSYTGTSYGVATGQAGRWQQILCSQDAWFGGWDGAGNAFYEPWTQTDGRTTSTCPIISNDVSPTLTDNRLLARLPALLPRHHDWGALRPDQGGGAVVIERDGFCRSGDVRQRCNRHAFPCVTRRSRGNVFRWPFPFRIPRPL
jgi:Alpha amylase, C-terminal all-beta domain